MLNDNELSRCNSSPNLILKKWDAVHEKQCTHRGRTRKAHTTTRFSTRLFTLMHHTVGLYRGVDKSLANQEGNQLQRQKIFMFIYPYYNHNWRNISTIYIYIYIYIYIIRLASKEIFSPSKKYIGKQAGLRTYQHPCKTQTSCVSCEAGN